MNNKDKLWIDTYLKAKSTYVAAQILGISRSVLYRRLKTLKINLIGRSGPRKENKIKINEKYFNNIDTPEKAYWLGFIAADGCVRKQSSGSYALSIRLSQKDLSILVKLKEVMDSSHKIWLRQEGPYKVAMITITRKEITDDLMRFGIVPNKTMELFHIPELYTSHWLRGLFDGDGSFWLRKRLGKREQVCFGFTCATLDQINQIKSLLSINGVSGGSISKASVNGYHLNYEGNNIVKSIAMIIYKDCEKVSKLDRKFNIIKHLLEPGLSMCDPKKLYSNMKALV